MFKQLRLIIIITCSFQFINPAGDPEDIRKAVEAGIQSGIEQVQSSQNNYWFAKWFLFLGVGAGSWYLFKKYGWATKHDVDRIVKKKTQEDIKQVFNSLNNNIEPNLVNLRNNVNEIDDQLLNVNHRINKLKSQSAVHAVVQEAALDNLAEKQHQISNNFKEKSNSYGIAFAQLKNSASGIFSNLNRFNGILSIELDRRKKLNNQLSDADQEYDKLLNELSDVDGGQQTLLISISDADKLLDKAETQLTKQVCMLSMLNEEAQALHQLNRVEDLERVANKMAQIRKNSYQLNALMGEVGRGITGVEHRLDQAELAVAEKEKDINAVMVINKRTRKRRADVVDRYNWQGTNVSSNLSSLVPFRPNS